MQAGVTRSTPTITAPTPVEVAQFLDVRWGDYL